MILLFRPTPNSWQFEGVKDGTETHLLINKEIFENQLQLGFGETVSVFVLP